MRGDYSVSGPGTEGRQAPSLGAATSLAQTLAGKPDAPLGGTWYVRDADGSVVRHVTREERVILTTAAGEQPEPRKREASPAMTLEEAA